MEWGELERSVNQGNVPACVVLVGSEAFLRRRALSVLRAAALKNGEPAFNEDVLSGRGLRAATVGAAVRTLPMLAPRRFVLVRDVPAMDADELDKLAELITKPVAEACLVLVADKLDGRAKFSKAAKRAGVVVELKELKGAQLRRFVKDQASQRQTSLSEEAAAALVDAIGSDLSSLDDAVERLSLYAAGAPRIGMAEVQACIPRARTDSVWALVDAVAERREKAAVLATASLLRDREPPLRILALLARQMRLLAVAHEALSRGRTPAEAAAEAGAPPFKARELAAAARKVDGVRLGAAFRVLAEADLELKGARRDGGLVLEEAILRLCRGDRSDRYQAVVERRRKLFRASA